MKNFTVQKPWKHMIKFEVGRDFFGLLASGGVKHDAVPAITATMC